MNDIPQKFKLSKDQKKDLTQDVKNINRKLKECYESKIIVDLMKSVDDQDLKHRIYMALIFMYTNGALDSTP